MHTCAMELDGAVSLLHRLTSPGYLEPLQQALAALDRSEETTNYTRVALEAGRAELTLLHLWRVIENTLRAHAVFAMSPPPGDQDMPGATHLSRSDLESLAAVARTVHAIADSFHQLMRACMRASLHHRQIATACSRTLEAIRQENGRLLPSDDRALRLLFMQGVGTSFVNSNGTLTRTDGEIS